LPRKSPLLSRSSFLALVLFVTVAVRAQQAPVRSDSIVVTGTWEPVELDELDRSVSVLPVAGEELLLNSWLDALRLDPSVDLQERAPNGVQTDVSIRGGSFGQTLVLLNGIRVNDPQTGHHDMDLPVPVDAMARVEVLQGSGSTLYGSDAVGGVINVITTPPETDEFRWRMAAGNFGVNQERGSLSLVDGDLDEQLTFSRDFSSGFMSDRDYRNLDLASGTHWLSSLGASDVTFGWDDRPFGADQFYGDYPSWEDTKTWFGSFQQALGPDTEVSVSYRRHSDLYVLYRDDPEIYTNHHVDQSYVASLRHNQKVSTNVSLHYGAEFFRDTLVSNNLGNHQRDYGAGYLSVDARALQRFSFSAGIRENVLGTGEVESSPSATAGVWLNSKLKLRASASHAFRLPTYTDLFYHDPANLGNPNLKPERAWDYEGGLDWNPSARVRADVAVFQLRERDGIDYVRNSPTALWAAANIDQLQFTGAEASVDARLSNSQNLAVHFTALHGAEAEFVDLFTKYSFNYPSESAVVEWRGSFRHGFLARTRFGALNRRGEGAYALWDFYGGWGEHAVKPFLQLTNITSTHYYELPGLFMPTRAVVGGVEWALRWK
jgi:iron complex outermembrane recepter protein